MEYVAIVKVVGQTAPDEFGSWFETFKATEETTIGELVKKLFPKGGTNISFTVNTLQ